MRPFSHSLVNSPYPTKHVGTSFFTKDATGHVKIFDLEITPFIKLCHFVSAQSQSIRTCQIGRSLDRTHTIQAEGASTLSRQKEMLCGISVATFVCDFITRRGPCGMMRLTLPSSCDTVHVVVNGVFATRFLKSSINASVHIACSLLGGGGGGGGGAETLEVDIVRYR